PLNYAWIVALLSLSLGVMNILPIPPLDGGKIVLEVVEGVAGRPINRRLAIGMSVAGAVFLFSFIGYVMYADVMRYFINS
ncbi:MAG: site-2 protease family protein, partial [Coriobacteriia bacterium]|nr:site-2 protease family protein [Coriobacteriia bacterium]